MITRGYSLVVIIKLIAVFLLIGFGSTGLLAQTAADGARLDGWQGKISNIEQSLNDTTITDQQLGAIPDTLEKLRSQIRTYSEKLGPVLSDARERLDQLGPAPKDGLAEETPAIADERKNIEHQIALYDGFSKKADILLLRASQLIATANSKRRERFAAALLKPVPSYYSKALWTGMGDRIGYQMGRTLGEIGRWYDGVLKSGWWRLILALALPLAVVLLLGRLLAMIGKGGAVSDTQSESDISFQRRAALATRDIAFYATPLVGSLLTLYLSMTSLLPMKPEGEVFFGNMLLISGAAMMMLLMIWRSVSPKNKELAVFARRNRNLRPLITIFFLLIIVWWIDKLLVNNETILFTPYLFTVTRSLIAGVLFFSFWLSLLFIRRWTLHRPGHSTPVDVQTWAYIFIALFVAFGVVAMSLGYVALAHFIGSQLVVSGSILFGMALLHSTAEYVSQAGKVATHEEAGPRGARATSFSLSMISSLSLDIAIVIIGIPLLLLQWGFNWPEIRSWFLTMFVGFKIGDLTISLQAILIAFGIFAIGLVLTRVVQRWFMNRIRIGRIRETGLRDSLETGLAYSGFILSALASISYLGIGFGNLAIVAGALSVGIGFGLQSIFNNFVSGLILLVERPIKVGDFITVGDREGFVKKISVRATEIETVHRKSVIIPNANLISEPVVNWMHSDRIGRLDVPVGVSYDSDVEQVRKIILEVAAAHPVALKSPPPIAHFAGFGDSSLDFEMRVYLRDVSRHVAISSELRYALWHAFKEAEVEIPFPQRDLHIKDGISAPAGLVKPADRTA